MLQALVSTASRLLNNLSRTFLVERLPGPDLVLSAPPKSYQRLERVRVTDQVCRTMFEEFAAHRRSQRGDEEIGTVVKRDLRRVGHRGSDVLGIGGQVLPVRGSDRDAVVAHQGRRHLVLNR